MSDIAPIGPPSAASLGTTTRATRPDTTSTGSTRGSDQVEVSDTARFLSQLSKLPDVRQEVVDRVRKELSDGTYETPDKIDKAIENLSADLT